MKNLKAILIFSFLIFLFLGGCKINVVTNNTSQNTPLSPQLLLKSDSTITFFALGKNSYFVVSGSFYIVKNGVKTDLGKQLSIFTNEITQLKYINGKYYLFTSGGLYEIDENTFAIKSYFTANETLCSNNVNSVSANANFLIIGTDNGLTIHTINPAYNIQFQNYKLDRTNTGWYTFNTENSSVLSNEILRVWVNNHDMIMITDKGVTIYHWASDYFESYTKEDYFNNELITDFLEYQGNYYFISQTALYEFEPLSKSFKTFDPTQIVNDFRVDKMVKDDNKIFFLTPSAIFDFNVFSQIFEPIVTTDTFFNKNFIDLAYKNNLYIGTNLGLYILNNVNGTNKSLLLPKVIETININEKGDVYVATDYEIYQLK